MEGLAGQGAVVAGGRDIIVIGASAGGVSAVKELLGALPRDLPAAIFFVQHLAQSASSSDHLLFATFQGDPTMLPRVLRNTTPLQVASAEDGEPIERGRVYVGVRDKHLTVERGRVRVEDSPREGLYRPSVDVLFRAAARSYGRRVSGVVLSGILNDGTVGLWEVKKHGGVAIVQDPREARHPQMPQNAMDNVEVDHCLPAREIARRLVALALELPAPAPPRGRRLGKILVVEDEEMVALSLVRHLRELGYGVCGPAASGEDGMAQATSGAPDLVLMDVNLPGIRGTEAGKHIWQRLQIPVVYVTAYGDQDTIDEIKITEPYGYVLKPFRPEEIDAAIQLALERRDRETRDA